MLFTPRRNKTQERPLTRGKGPENYTLPDTKAQDRPPKKVAQDHQGQWTWALSGRLPGMAFNPEAKDLGKVGQKY